MNLFKNTLSAAASFIAPVMIFASCATQNFLTSSDAMKPLNKKEIEDTLPNAAFQMNDQGVLVSNVISTGKGDRAAVYYSYDGITVNGLSTNMELEHQGKNYTPGTTNNVTEHIDEKIALSTKTKLEEAKSNSALTVRNNDTFEVFTKSRTSKSVSPKDNP